MPTLIETEKNGNQRFPCADCLVDRLETTVIEITWVLNPIIEGCGRPYSWDIKNRDTLGTTRKVIPLCSKCLIEYEEFDL